MRAQTPIKTLHRKYGLLISLRQHHSLTYTSHCLWTYWHVCISGPITFRQDTSL